MGIVRFALRYQHTFYVLALLMVFLGGSAITFSEWRVLLPGRQAKRVGEVFCWPATWWVLRRGTKSGQIDTQTTLRPCQSVAVANGRFCTAEYWTKMDMFFA